MEFLFFILGYIMHVVEIAKGAPRAAQRDACPLARHPAKPVAVGNFFLTDETPVFRVSLSSHGD
jgi:hypothetical protein